MGKQRIFLEPGERDREQWTEPTQVAIVPPVTVLLTFSGSREMFPVSWLVITLQEAYL